MEKKQSVGFWKGSAEFAKPIGAWLAIGALGNAYVYSVSDQSAEDPQKNGILLGWANVSARTEASILGIAGTVATIYATAIKAAHQ